MNYKILALIAISLCTSCSSKKVDYSKQPVTVNPLWKELEGQLKLKLGQRIEIDSINALVADVAKDEGGIWYGLCFYNEKGLFGRQIPSSLSVTGCVDLLDVDYINERGLPSFTIIDTLNIIHQIRVGAESASSTYTDLLSSYRRGIERRKLTQTPCDEGVYDLNPVRECYFPFNSYGTPAL